MKVIPFLISTVVCALCFVLSVLFYFKAGSNRDTKTELIKQQAANQELQQKVKDLDEIGAHQQKIYNISAGIAQLRQNDLQSMQRIVETGNSVDQKLLPQVVSNIGYLAAKNDNKGLKKILTDRKWERFILSAEDLKKVEDQIKNQGTTTTPAPAPAPAPVAPRPNPR
jgi:hypothetical protein